MIKKIVGKLFNREIIMYLIFGVLTTVVNWAVTFVCQKVFGLNEVGIKMTVANGIAWFCAVLFAFFTNRSFVFERTDNSFIAEMLKFYGARIFTGLFEILLPDLIVMLAGVGNGALSFLEGEFFGITGGVAKAITSVVVIVLNYVLSKLIVFRRKKENNYESSHQTEKG